MRGLFSTVGLLVVLATVGLLVKHQLGAAAARKAADMPSSPVSDALNGKVPQVNTPAQARQLQQQVQSEVDSIVQKRAADLEQQQQQADSKP